MAVIQAGDSSRDSVMLRGFWYSPLRSEQLGRGRPRGRGALKKAMLLGTPLVIGRDREGRPFAMRDSCPHRGMPLSLGHFDGTQLECHYHGWRFDALSGQCRLIPSLTAESKLDVGRIHAGHFACEEHDGYIWTYVPYPGTKGDPEEPCPRLPVFSDKYTLMHLAADLPLSIDHGIIGLMDPAHGPFVHQAWWWRSQRSIHEKEKHFEPVPLGFRMSAHAPSTNSGPYKLLHFYGDAVTTQIDFVLPNMRTELVQCGKKFFVNRTTVTPIRRDLCRLDFVAAWNIFTWLPVSLLLDVFGARFIAQDRRVIDAQQPGLKVQPKMMLIDDADRQARWYFELKDALLTSRRTGQPMTHPLPGPVTLKWRS